jgi:hypothetical protein
MIYTGETWRSFTRSRLSGLKKRVDQNPEIWSHSFGVNQEYPRLQFISGAVKQELEYQRRDHVTSRGANKDSNTRQITHITKVLCAVLACVTSM